MYRKCNSFGLDFTSFVIINLEKSHFCNNNFKIKKKKRKTENVMELIATILYFIYIIFPAY